MLFVYWIAASIVTTACICAFCGPACNHSRSWKRRQAQRQISEDAPDGDWPAVPAGFTTFHAGEDARA